MLFLACNQYWEAENSITWPEITPGAFSRSKQVASCTTRMYIAAKHRNDQAQRRSDPPSLCRDSSWKCTIRCMDRILCSASWMKCGSKILSCIWQHQNWKIHQWMSHNNFWSYLRMKNGCYDYASTSSSLVLDLWPFRLCDLWPCPMYFHLYLIILNWKGPNWNPI